MFDIQKYLVEKTDKAGVIVRKPTFTVNQDAITFLLCSGSRTEPISISGLEAIQNSTDESIKDLLDTRFRSALEKLQDHSGL